MSARLPALAAASSDNRVLTMVAVGLAGFTALIYFVIAGGIGPGNVTSPPAPIMFVAGVSYLVGGGLILLRRRSLLIFGAFINPLVIIAFVASFFLDRSELEFLSIASKIGQAGLELVLLMLIARTPARRIA